MAAAKHLVRGFGLFHRLASLLSGRTDRPSGRERPSAATSDVSPSAEAGGEHEADPQGATDFHTLSGLTKTEAEALLDQLQAAGCEQFEVTEASNKGFTVRFKLPGG
jgi:hypothetical protein